MASVHDLIAQTDLALTLITSGTAENDIVMTLTGSLEEVLPVASSGTLLVITSPDATDWRQAVATASQVRASAIAVRTEVLTTSGGSELVAAASDYRLTVIGIPPATSFPAITAAVSQLRRTDSLRQAREALLAQRRILDLAFDGSGVAGIVSTVASLTSRQVALLAQNGDVVASTAGFQRELERGVETSQKLSIGTARELVITGPPLDPEGLSVLTSAAIVLSVEERMSSHNTVLERERWGRVTRAILTGHGDPHALTTLLDPAESLPDECHVIVVQGAAEEIASWRSLPRGGGERFITRYSLGDTEDPSTVPGIAVAWQVVAPELLPRTVDGITQHGLDAIVSVRTAISEAPVSRRSAEALLGRLSPQQQLYQHPRSSVVLYAAEANPITSLLAAAPSRHSISRSVLGSLSLSHPNTDHELRETLRVFLSHHGGRAQTAEALGIHRNTLRTRLSRIEDLLGTTLNSPDTRAELWLALRFEG